MIAGATKVLASQQKNFQNNSRNFGLKPLSLPTVQQAQSDTSRDRIGRLTFSVEVVIVLATS